MLTGEPDAGEPLVRFGGRGGINTAIPTPIKIWRLLQRGLDHRASVLRVVRHRFGLWPRSIPINLIQSCVRPRALHNVDGQSFGLSHSSAFSDSRRDDF